jgi:membrane-bound ClpP family serine protease
MILDILIIVFLLGIAIVLILVEIFLLPGITLAGVGGALFAIGGVVYAYSINSAAGHVALIASIVSFGGAFAWLLRAKSFSKVALHTDIHSKVTSARELDIHPGDEGLTLSRLAPIGKATIHGITVEAKSTGGFIDENTAVRVIRVDGNNVLVAEKDIIHS